MTFRVISFLFLLPSLLHSQQTLLILHKGGNSLGFYDAESGRQSAAVSVGLKPHEFVITQDFRLAYVTNYGADSYTDKSLGGNTISIVDLPKKQQVGVIVLKEYHRPHGIEMDSRGHLIVTTDFPAALLVIDPARKEILQHIEIDHSLPHMVAITPDGEKAYTANAGDGTVSVIHLLQGKVLKHIEVGGVPMGFATASDGRRVYATNRTGNTVAVIDTAADEVNHKIHISGQPARLRLTSEGKFLLVSLIESGEVAVVDVGGLREIRRFHVGLRCEGINIDPEGQFGYVSAQGDDKVVKFSLTSWRPVLTIKTKAKPDPIAFIDSSPN